MKVLKRCFLILGLLFGLLLLAAAALFVTLTVTEYRPEPEKELEIVGIAPALDKKTVTVLSWNTGYCALGAESDFFMDGGEQVRPASVALIQKNLGGIQEYLSAQDADFHLLQEVDTDSKRSYEIDEAVALREDVSRSSAYALNFSCNYVPYPWPPIGKVHSGLLTTSRYAISDATRISLPCSFSWPVSMANLKRCLLVTRIQIAGSEKELVLVNLHLEAYDDGAGKLAQSEQLRTFLTAEYEKGNYIVAGGDWNQIFPNTESAWPNTHRELWTPGYLDENELDEGWRYLWDDSVPTCRLLNQPYDPADAENTQYYVIDGFLVSPNLVGERMETLDADFAYTDHNPVRLTLTLGD